jgi:hypothetical protein
LWYAHCVVRKQQTAPTVVGRRLAMRGVSTSLIAGVAFLSAMVAAEIAEGQ